MVPPNQHYSPFVTYLAPHAGYKGPVVLVKPENLTIDEGQSAKFYCKLSEEVDTSKSNKGMLTKKLQI